MKKAFQILHEAGYIINEAKEDFVDSKGNPLKVDQNYIRTIQKKSRVIQIVEIGDDHFKYTDDRFGREIMRVPLSSYKSRMKTGMKLVPTNKKLK